MRNLILFLCSFLLFCAAPPAQLPPYDTTFPGFPRYILTDNFGGCPVQTLHPRDQVFGCTTSSPTAGEKVWALGEGPTFDNLTQNAASVGTRLGFYRNKDPLTAASLRFCVLWIEAPLAGTPAPLTIPGFMSGHDRWWAGTEPYVIANYTHADPSPSGSEGFAVLVPNAVQFTIWVMPIRLDPVWGSFAGNALRARISV